MVLFNMPISKAALSLRICLQSMVCFVLTEEARSSKFSRGAATPEPAPIEPAADTKDKKKKKKGKTDREYGSWLVNSYRFMHVIRTLRFLNELLLVLHNDTLLRQPSVNIVHYLASVCL